MSLINFFHTFKVSPGTGNSHLHCKIYKNLQVLFFATNSTAKKGNLFHCTQALTGTAKRGQGVHQGYLFTEKVQEAGRGIREICVPDESPNACTEITGMKKVRNRISAACVSLD